MQAADSSDEPALAALVGQTLPLKVIEVDRDQNRLVLSEREAVKEARRQQKETLLAELEEGSIRQGIVSGLCSFGAFVDLGGADGLVHISELSWDHVDDPKDVLQIGDEVEVQVLKVDRQRDRIGLSMKRLHPEPWDQVDENYYIGQLVDASITKLTDFGAFARLEDGIEGLVHISELSEEHVSHPREVVQKGDSLKLRVIDIDSARRRIGLSLRRAIDQFDAEVS
jgi:small subunit ribosomal protein S1